MTLATHATLATFEMDPARESEHRAGLEQMIVPGVRRHPGFVAGTWTLDRETSESLVMLTYDSQDAAEAMRDNIVQNADNQRAAGITLLGVRILEVSATAGFDEA